MRTLKILLKSLVVAVFIFGIFCSKSGNGREINSEQLQKRGDGLYYAVNEEKPYSGKVVELYESGQKQTERAISNGKLHGLSITWYSDGQKKTEVTYKNGKQQGNRNFGLQNGEKLDTGKVTDIDGNTYRTVKIGEQVWMAENLKVTHYRNGDPIPNVTENSEWSDLTTGAYCYYDNNSNNADDYGALYNWFAVNDSRNIAPEGWHVPTDEEWKQLEMYLGMSQKEADDILFRGTNEGGKLKETGTTLWSGPNEGATNESGFSARPGGWRYGSGDFDSMGTIAGFWSSTAYDCHGAWGRRLHCSNAYVYRSSYGKRYGFSVRLVRD